MEESIKEWAVLWAAIGGAAVAGTFSVITLLITKYFEDRRDRRESAFRLALERWKCDVERAQKRPGYIPPLESYLLSAAEMARIVSDSHLSDYDFRMAIRTALARNHIIGEEINRANKRAQPDARDNGHGVSGFSER